MNNTRNILNLVFESKNTEVGQSFKDYIQRHTSETPVQVIEPEWSTVHEDDHSALNRLFKFSNLDNLLYFVNEVSRASEKKGHHPRIVIDHDVVKVKLYTRDINDVTNLDLELSSDIDEIYEDISYLQKIK
tara:strand:- start:5564 stop:5956 length:393 start_codon:yes stop_codon:yes gene_type:complete